MFKYALILTILLISTPVMADHTPTFDELDQDHDDILTNNELAEELAELKATLSTFGEADVDLNGNITRAEYEAWTRKLHE